MKLIYLHLIINMFFYKYPNNTMSEIYFNLSNQAWNNIFFIITSQFIDYIQCHNPRPGYPAFKSSFSF